MSSITPIVSGAEWFVTKPVLEKSIAWQEGMLAVILLLALGGVTTVVLQARRTRQWFPIFVCIGGALCAFYEPLGDLLSHVTYHEVNQVNFTTAFGFHIPLWILPCYLVSFGVPIILLANVLENGIGMKKWMTFYALAFVGGWAFEVPMILMGAIEYYGDNQPFRILGFPVWLGFVNNATMFTVASFVYLLKRSSVGERWPALVVVLMPVMVGGTHAGLSLAAGSAINSSHDLVFVNLMATVSALLGVVATMTAGYLVMSARRPDEAARTHGIPVPA